MRHLFLSLLIIRFVSIHAQPASSRVAGRFLFQEVYVTRDSTQLAVSLPLWHPLAQTGGGGYLVATNRYGMAGLTECLVGGSHRVAHGSMRWSGTATGDAIYQHVSGQFMLIRNLSERFHLGTGIGFSYARVAGYGSRWMPVGSIVLGGIIGPRTLWGLNWDNPQHLLVVKGWLSHTPMRIRFGVAQSISARLSVFGGMEWEPGLANGSILRLVYRPVDDWRLEVGTGWRPDQVMLGLNRRLKRGWLALSFAQEWSLGSSFLIGYSWQSVKRAML